MRDEVEVDSGGEKKINIFSLEPVAKPAQAVDATSSSRQK